MPLADVLGESNVYISLYGDVVLIIEHNQLAQFKSAGKRGGFLFYSFLEASVSHQDVGVMVYYGEAVPIEFSGQMAFGYSHAYGVGYALSQRSGSSFNPGSVAVFGMAGSAAAPLPEGFNILHCYVVAADMQSGIKQHGAVPRAEYKTVAVGKSGILGIVLHSARKSGVGYGGGAHGKSGMAAVGFLNALGRNNADGVYGFLLYGFHLLLFLLGFFSLRN